MKSLLAVLTCLLLSSGATLAAPCTTPDVTGLYSGSASTPGGVKTDVTVNIYCDGDHVAAQLFTSMGDFQVKDTKAERGQVTIDFDSGASLGTLVATRKGNLLSGSFTMADDAGTASFTRTGDAIAADAMKPRLDVTPAQWHEDLRYLATELPKRHANAFFSLSKAAFDAEVAALDKRIDTSNGDEVFVGLQQIAKSIGDGHTGVFALGIDRRVMPLTIAKFGDDLRVVAAGPGYENMIGTRVIKIGGMPIADVWAHAMTITPQGELEQLRREDALIYLVRGYILHGLDVIADRNHAVYTVKDDSGRVFDVDVQGLKPGENATMKSGYSDAALRFQNKDAPFWCKPLDESHAVYCAWRSYQDLDKNAKAMFAAVDQSHASKLIIDMRDNGGGDNTVGDAQILKPIKARPDLNVRGRLYVLIGPETFSAAMNNAAQFQDETNAILVGETIGEKPNSYQEPRQFRLPNSHVIVRASTLFYTYRKTGENAVRPAKEIIPTWDDVKNGRDPVMTWVLAQPVN